VAWPGRLHVHVLSESMTGASSVWNAMLGMWNQVKAQPGWDPEGGAAPTPPDGFPIRVSEMGTAPAGPAAASGAGTSLPPIVRVSRLALEPARAKKALAAMAPIEGMLGYAVVDSTTGLVLARESRDEAHVDMDLAAAACAQVLRAHRSAARNMGLPDHVDEIMTSAGPRQQIMRCLTLYPDLFLVALLDRQRTNLALARFQLLEVERGLT